MNRKGFMNDFVIYICMLFILSIAIIVIYMAFSKTNTAWQGAASLPQGSKNIVNNFVSRFPAIWDNVFVFWVFGLLIVLVIIGLALRLHPAFIGIAIIFLIAVSVVGIHLANTFFDFSTAGEIATYSAEFDKTTFLMKKLPHIVLAFGAIFLIVMFAKSRAQTVEL